VQRSSATACSRQRLEGFGRIDHGGAVGEAAQVAHHHAEAVVERHRDAHPVARPQADRLADEEAVVEDVVVRQVAPLGLPVVPEVNWMLIGSSNCRRSPSSASSASSSRRAGEQVAEVEHAGAALGAQADHDLQAGQAMGAQQAGFAVGQLGRQVGQHRQVVAALEGRRQDQRPAADLVEGVFEFAAAIGRVDVDQHQPGLGGGELGQRPFVVVLRPEPDPLAGRQAQAAQAAGQRIHLERSSA
jgi:hypothetical protein